MTTTYLSEEDPLSCIMNLFPEPNEEKIGTKLKQKHCLLLCLLGDNFKLIVHLYIQGGQGVGRVGVAAYVITSRPLKFSASSICRQLEAA